VTFRVWAPEAERVELELESGGARGSYPLAFEGEGHRAVTVPHARPGDRYCYRVDGQGPFPDPCSRSQPEGPHGASQVCDPGAFRWTDVGWPGLTADGLVIYELHAGTFTA